MSAIDAAERDPFDAELALRAPAELAPFNRAGLLSAADIHVARALVSLSGAEPPGAAAALLAAALAVRAPRLGHVFVDLATVAETAAGEFDADALAELQWPEPDPWIAELSQAGTLVAVGDHDEPGAPRPLRLVSSRLYLDRYWRAERRLADALSALDRSPVRAGSLEQLAALVASLFPEPGDGGQRVAAASGALRGLTVIAGGPGTGKTTTVARLVALLAQLEDELPLIALCAPTGKAAARLTEALRAQAATPELPSAAAAALGGLTAVTMHRLLGARGDGRFLHGASNPLPHDVVIVDETSMVSLSMMSRLLDSVRPDARLVLVGDPDQLSAIEAGAVLRDIVGPAAGGSSFTPGVRAILAKVTGAEVAAAPAGRPFGDGIVVLRRGHRFGEAIAALADAIRRGDGDGTVAAARAAPGVIEWLEVDAVSGAGPVRPAPLQALRDAAVDAYEAVLSAARDGDGPAALAALGRFRLLCAHRLGPYGVGNWTARVQEWLADAVPVFDSADPDYAGRPLLVTENDYELRLFNGDTGVLVAAPEGSLAAFERDGELALVAPSRLASVQTVYAMTVHKSQGSQFQTAAVILPDPTSRLLSRELLYTAVTRAAEKLLLVGTEESLRVAVSRPVARATALGERLWKPTVV